MLRCPTCGARIFSFEGLAEHQAIAHRALRPMLIFKGRVVGAGGLVVLSKTIESDWRPINAIEADLNGVRIGAEDLAASLSSRRRGTDVVRLIASDGSTSDLRIRFDLADDESLRTVDRQMTGLLPVATLDRASIDEFLASTQGLSGGTRYVDGIAQYLYGVLALDAPEASGLPLDRYVEKFERSAHALEGFATTTASAIRGLIALRFNHAARVELSVDLPLLSTLALFLEDALSGGIPELSPDVPAATSVEALADRGMSEVLDAFREVSASRGRCDGDALLIAHQHLLPEDRLKITLLAVECQLASGHAERAVEVARSVGNRPGTERWATNVLRRASEIAR